ncbi:ATP-binding protein [Clostridium baratii]|uniref:VirB4 family type IV secretion system protein n=1 Tax=Clostridium baratii TaxID=1561 RepID=UPI0030CC80CA
MAKEIEYNPYLLAKVQPVGGIGFGDTMIKKGDGYEACVQIYDYPVNVNVFWLESLLDYEEALVTLDISTEKQEKALGQINRSISENLNRIADMKSQVEKITAEKVATDLASLVRDINEHDEVIKLIRIRYYLFAETKNELESKIEELRKKLKTKGYRSCVFLNETEHDYNSMFESYSQQNNRISREGKPIPSYSLGGGYPFNYVQLDDSTGQFLGTSDTGGSVIFDMFTRNDIRKSYNMIVVGLMGAGKSTLLKKLLKQQYIVGTTIRTLDLRGEFKTLTKKLGGKSIALDGTDGIINPLQVFATVIDEHTNEVQDEQSFQMHKSKMSVFYKFLSPNSTDDEQREFDRILSDFYYEKGIIGSKCTRYEVEEYPLMEELVEYTKRQLYSDINTFEVRKNITESRQERLERIILTLEWLVRDYSKLFNGYTTIKDFEDEQLINFEIKNLAGFDKRIFNAQVFNVLTLLWNSALVQGIKEKKAYEQGEKSLEDTIKFLLIVDEAHKLINTNNMMIVDYFLDYEREARKYFGGLILATQSIRDFVNEGANSHDLEKIKTLFELTQYKIIMQQDNNSKKMLGKIFSGQLNESEISRIPNFKKGDCILAINGMNNIQLNIEMTAEEEKIFEGGA